MIPANLSLDGKQIVSGSSDCTICLGDAASGQVVASKAARAISSVTFSPDGKQIVSAFLDKTLCLWDAVGGQLIAPPKGHTDWVSSVVFSSDSKQIISGSSGCTICHWDAVTGQLIRSPFNSHMYPVQSIASSQDGKQVVDNGTICLWDVASRWTTPQGPHTFGIICCFLVGRQGNCARLRRQHNLRLVCSE